MRGSVTIHMAAPADRVWDLVSDVTRVGGGPGKSTVNSWRYQLEPAAGGTDVTESFELPDTPLVRLYWLVAGRARRRVNLDGMRTTLEKVKAVAESG
jgi:hypothetical protein